MSFLTPRNCTWFQSLILVVAPIASLASFATSFGGDWAMRGRDHSRNAVSLEHNAPVDWKLVGDHRNSTKMRRNVRWSARLGAQSRGDPVIAGGLIWVGTDNSRPRNKAESADASVLMCFNEQDGAFLYQYLSPRLELQRDWPYTGLASSPLVEGDRLWFCNNRCQVICLDIAALQSRTGQPRVVWIVDMPSQMGVVPRGVMLGSSASHCSIASYKDLIYVNTTNAAGNKGVPAPDAPSLICLEKQTGLVRWKDNSPGKNILDVQHGSPLVIERKGGGQVIMGQGDGWVRAFDAETGEMLWKFDINLKSAEPLFTANGKRSDLVAMPVVYEGRVYFGVGRQLEMCVGLGRLCCLDTSKRGDISAELDDSAGRGRRNPNSGLIWEYLGHGDEGKNPMHRTLSSVVVHDGIVIAPDFSGLVHCLDARTGERFWIHDTKSQIATSPLIVGDKVFVANEIAVFIFELSKEKNLIGMREASSLIEASPVYANGVLYVTTRDELFAIGE